jgi:SnoaL-like domain
MRRLIISTLIILFAAIHLHAQAAADSPEQKLAEEFLKRLNALDDWYLTVDGKEQGVDQLVDSMMELYAPDVLAEVPPHDPEQIGQVMLRGKENVRKWVERIARTQVRLNYILKRQTDGPTGDFEGWRLVYSTKLPWGGNAIAFQIIGVWSLREDRRRYTAPGAVFIQYGADGKIRRLRMLLAEIDEVVPL